MSVIKVTPNALGDAARSLRYRGREVAEAGGALTRALGGLGGCATYLPDLPATGNVMEIAAADLEDHGNGIDRFVEAVLESDRFLLDSMVAMPGSTGSLDDVGLPTLANLLPGVPFQTDYGVVRVNGSRHELLGPDGQWYWIDVARADAGDHGWRVTDRDQRLGRWPDRGIDATRGARAFLALLGGPSGTLSAASAEDYTHLFFDEDGRPYIDDDETNDVRLGSSDREGGGGLLPGDVPQESPDSNPNVAPVLEGSRPALTGGIDLAANGINAFGVLVMPEERAYLTNLTFEQAGDDRRVVIEAVNLTDEGFIQEGGIVGWDGETPIFEERPDNGWPAMGTLEGCAPPGSTPTERSGPHVP